MKSKAHIKTHPLHPILVTFPIAFFTGALLFDVLALLRRSDELFFVASCLQVAGIAGGLAAAVPGIIDAVYTVPPESSARKRAVIHGLLNSGVLITFVICALLRDHLSAAGSLMLQGAAVVTMWISGWMGGTLVHRNHISVYNRYANSGHWNESYIKGTITYPVEVAASGELKTDQMKLVHVGGSRIVIARTAQGVVAFDDRCTHRGGSLAGGTMICGTVQCPWHGSQFDVCSGETKAGPATTPLRTHPVMEQNGKIFLSG